MAIPVNFDDFKNDFYSLEGVGEAVDSFIQKWEYDDRRRDDVLLFLLASNCISEYDCIPSSFPYKHIECIENIDDDMDTVVNAVFMYKEKYYSCRWWTSSYSYTPHMIYGSLQEVFPYQKTITIYK